MRLGGHEGIDGSFRKYFFFFFFFERTGVLAHTGVHVCVCFFFLKKFNLLIYIYTSYTPFDCKVQAGSKVFGVLTMWILLVFLDHLENSSGLLGGFLDQPINQSSVHP